MNYKASRKPIEIVRSIKSAHTGQDGQGRESLQIIRSQNPSFEQPQILGRRDLDVRGRALGEPYALPHREHQARGVRLHLVQKTAAGALLVDPLGVSVAQRLRGVQAHYLVAVHELARSLAVARGRGQVHLAVRGAGVAVQPAVLALL